MHDPLERVGGISRGIHSFRGSELARERRAAVIQANRVIVLRERARLSRESRFLLTSGRYIQQGYAVEVGASLLANGALR